METERYVTDNPERYRIFRLCDCPTCGGRGQLSDPYTGDPPTRRASRRCGECRGEGRIRQELATCATPEAVGVAIVTLAREGEWDECPLGLLDTTPECETCHGERYLERSWIENTSDEPCGTCNGSGVKPTGTWLILPWTPSARNLRDAGRMLQGARKHG